MKTTQASRQLQAVRWILEGAAMKPPVKRTQTEAAKKFGIKQSVVSYGMDKYVRPHGVVPDGRRKRVTGL